MDVAAWFRPPRQVVTTFVAVAALSAAVLGGLAWQLLAQDRDLEVRRQQIELDARADALVASMQQALTRLEPLIRTASSTAQPPTPLPDGVVG